MTEDMPRKLPPFVYSERTRHGRRVWYFRRGKGPRIRLPDYGAPDFEEKYHDALLNVSPAPRKRVAGAGSLGWLIARYRETTAYMALSRATRRQRDNIFHRVVEKSGHVAFKSITRKTIIDGRERRAATPAQARNFLDAMRGLFEWAEEAEHATTDPTVGVKNPPRQKNDGFPAWTDEDVEIYEKHWPAGTKERVWLHLLLYTGLRRGDAVVIGKQHVRNEVAALRTEKGNVEVYLRIHAPLAKTLSEGPTGDLAFIVGEERKPLTKETFGNYFREACNAAGIKKSAHGLRKLAATRAAENSATTEELKAMFGWTSDQMPSLYTKGADRKRLAEEGARKMENVYSPHPEGNSPHPEKSLAETSG